MARVTVGSAGKAVEVHDLPEHLSYSQLTMLHPAYRYACPRKWGYRYRLGLPDEASAALLTGRAFDEAANRYFVARLQGTASPLDAAAAAIERATTMLEDALRDVPAHVLGARERPEPEWVEERIAQYVGVLVSAFAAFLNVEGEREAALIQDRHTFVLRLDERHEMPIVGYSDRVDADGTLVDHKFSGSPRWDKAGTWDADWIAERQDQLLIYWLSRAAEEKRRGEALTPPLSGLGRLVVTYHRVGLSKPQVEVKELLLSLEEGGRELLERLGEAARTAQEGRYPARPGLACRYCSYVARCREDETARGRPFFELIDLPF